MRGIFCCKKKICMIQSKISKSDYYKKYGKKIISTRIIDIAKLIGYDFLYDHSFFKIINF